MGVFNKRRVFLLSIIALALILRVWKLGSFPPSVYSDEASLGYNAYSLLKTSRDEFGRRFPLAFQSFGDWKPALPAYLAIPSIMVFGLNAFGLRLTHAILTAFTVLGVYLLIKSLFFSKLYVSKVALCAALLLSVSPWHILHSRALLFEGIGLFFLMYGTVLFLHALKRQSFVLFFLSALSFTLSMYSYHSLRIVTPLLIIFFILSNWSILRTRVASILVFFAVLLLLGMPFMLSVIKTPSILTGRARFISIFYDQGIRLRIEEYERADGSIQNTKITNLFHNKPYLYGMDILSRYFSHLNANFLFLQGDRAAPFQIPNMGFLYLFDLPFLLIGSFFLVKKFAYQKKLILFWLFVGIIPASLTFLTPSSNRIFNSIIPIVIITSFGIFAFIKRFPHKVLIPVIISCGYILSFAFFLHQFFLVLPVKNSQWWHYGFEELVSVVQRIGPSYDRIIISDRVGVPYIFFLYYLQYSPSRFQAEARVDFHKDRLGFIHVNGFHRYEFVRFFNWSIEKKNLYPHSLYVVRSEESPTDLPLYEVKDPTGKSIFKFYASS